MQEEVNGWACTGVMRNVVWCDSLKVSTNLEELGVDGRIKIKID